MWHTGYSRGHSSGYGREDPIPCLGSLGPGPGDSKWLVNYTGDVLQSIWWFSHPRNGPYRFPTDGAYATV